MYIGKKKILRIDEYNKRRKEIIETKAGAVWNACIELDGLVGTQALAEQYFERSRSWLNKRLHGCTYDIKEEAFNADEFHQLAEAYRDIAKRLLAHADEIEAAQYE